MSAEHKAKIIAARTRKEVQPFKKCTKCKIVLPSMDFGRRSKDRLLRSHCKPCERALSREYWGARKEQQRIANRKGAFTRRGITEADFDRMMEEQGGVCAICGKPETMANRRLYVDHDHSCCPPEKSCGACVRGLLCNRCNMGIGYLSDDPDQLETAATYIRRYRY